MPNSRRKTILVVDDQPVNVKLLKIKLEREGYKVLSAINGKECLEKAQSEVPDLILLDVMMPEMDGLEACKHLKQNELTRMIPIIFVTARTTRESRIEGLELGAIDYISKPIDLEETIARVKAHLRMVDIYSEWFLSQQVNIAEKTEASES